MVALPVGADSGFHIKTPTEGSGQEPQAQGRNRLGSAILPPTAEAATVAGEAR